MALKTIKKITYKSYPDVHIIKIQKDEYGNMYINHENHFGVLKIKYDDFRKKTQKERQYFCAKCCSVLSNKLKKIS